MITQEILKGIAHHFPDLLVLTESANGATMTIPARHPEVGAVSIWEAGSEAIVGIGEITHGHFGDYRKDISAEERAQAIAEDVIAFLGLLFADRVLLWKAGRSGGWRVLQTDEGPMVYSNAGTRFYLWSGPIVNRS